MKCSSGSEKFLRKIGRATLSNIIEVARQASDKPSYYYTLGTEAQSEPEFDKSDFLGKLRYYVDHHNSAVALPYVFRVLNDLPMTNILKALTGLNDTQREKINNNWEYAVSVNMNRIFVALMAVMARRRKTNFDCCLFVEFAKDYPGQQDIVVRYLSRSATTPLPTDQVSHEISDNGINFIAEEERFVDHLYNDPAGHCTIGFGHLIHRGRCTAADRAKWGARIKREDALGLLLKDAQRFVSGVNHLVRVKINQPQFDALVSFHFNTGALRSSSALRELNQCKYEKVPGKLALYNKARNEADELIELPGLTARRAKEGAMFLSVPICQ